MNVHIQFVCRKTLISSCNQFEIRNVFLHFHFVLASSYFAASWNAPALIRRPLPAFTPASFSLEPRHRCQMVIYYHHGNEALTHKGLMEAAGPRLCTEATAHRWATVDEEKVKIK